AVGGPDVRAGRGARGRRVAVAVEITGPAGGQGIRVAVRSDRTPIGELVDWPRIGTLTEVVVSVTPAGDAASAVGTLSIDAQFEQLSLLQKLSISPAGRLGGVLLASLLVALFSMPLGTGGGPPPAGR